MQNLSIPESIRDASLSPVLTDALEIRRKHFPDTIRFHNPGLKRHQTSEITCQQTQEFVSISLPERIAHLTVNTAVPVYCEV